MYDDDTPLLHKTSVSRREESLPPVPELRDSQQLEEM